MILFELLNSAESETRIILILAVVEINKIPFDLSQQELGLPLHQKMSECNIAPSHFSSGIVFKNTAANNTKIQSSFGICSQLIFLDLHLRSIVRYAERLTANRDEQEAHHWPDFCGSVFNISGS